MNPAAAGCITLACLLGRPAFWEAASGFYQFTYFLSQKERMPLYTDCMSFCSVGVFKPLVWPCVPRQWCLYVHCVCVRMCVCVPGRGPFKPEREPSSSLSGASRGSRRRAVGNHRPASADYSLLRKMRFLSHRNSVIKIKYNVWLDSAKCTSTGAF